MFVCFLLFVVRSGFLLSTDRFRPPRGRLTLTARTGAGRRAQKVRPSCSRTRCQSASTRKDWRPRACVSRFRTNYWKRARARTHTCVKQTTTKRSGCLSPLTKTPTISRARAQPRARTAHHKLRNVWRTGAASSPPSPAGACREEAMVLNYGDQRHVTGLILGGDLVRKKANKKQE